MRKIVLLIAGFIAFNMQAQIQIQEQGSGPDISGTTINVVIDPSEVNASANLFWYESFIITNNTGASGDWYITCKKVSAPATWTEYVCWPPSCFSTGNGFVFETPHDAENPAPTILNGTSSAVQLGDTYVAELKPQITPDYTTNGSATYSYYITDATTGVYLDSLTINFSYPFLSTKSVSPSASLSIAPNPANDFVSITLEGTETAVVKIADVLGNTVYSKQVTGATKVGTSDFNSGVYFITIQGENKKAITKKLIVKH